MLYLFVSLLDTAWIEIKGYRLMVEVARTPEEKSKGLMYRKELPDSMGMLFVFDKEGYYPFWMKNTFIPLSIAFISKEGVIVDMRDMQPMSEEAIVSLKPFKYALEVNRGWFILRGIGIGDTVRFVED